MKREFKFKLLMAGKGGMTQSEDGRDIFPTDNELAMAMGKWILEEMDMLGEDDAEVAVTITTIEK